MAATAGCYQRFPYQRMRISSSPRLTTAWHAGRTDTSSSCPAQCSSPAEISEVLPGLRFVQTRGANGHMPRRGRLDGFFAHGSAGAPRRVAGKKPLKNQRPFNHRNLVAGACFGATKTEVVCFSADNARQPVTSGPRAIPSACGNGHPLSPENVQIDQGEGRWRCRQCGRERAVAFRGRQKAAA
ncbi:MAG: hypothetical protein JWM63_2165 [Gammaproteobacteria bacterium]|nr:hypothetical protein [Gammaproteobacteria bacterium]